MIMASNSAPERPADPLAGAPAAEAAVRPMYWSVRRELWENRSIYVAPVAVAVVVLLGFLISMAKLPQRARAASALDPSAYGGMLDHPYAIAATLILATAFLIGVFYSLDALHGERRDRSILFWKSLPVSDLTTVLAKASIPLVILPLLVFVLIVATQLTMLFVGSVVLLANGLSAGPLWAQLPLLRMALALLYTLVVLALWYAPVYGWLLLVSGWARRMTFLWAVLPLLVLCVVERVAFGTSYLASMLKYRLTGWFSEAFDADAQGSLPFDPLGLLDPVRLLSSPGLWIGLVAAAALLAAAVALRRYRQPI
jgi:ABC-2 type transport system permease protein